MGFGLVRRAAVPVLPFLPRGLGRRAASRPLIGPAAGESPDTAAIAAPPPAGLRPGPGSDASLAGDPAHPGPGPGRACGKRLVL